MGFGDFKKNIPLAPYTSLRIGGPAEYFFEAKNKDALREALLLAKKENIPITILGGGQNVLIRDKGIRGLVIAMRMKHITIEDKKVYAEAGAVIGELLSKTVAAGLAGLEWAGGLPGTIGGAVFGNAGTFGHAFGEFVTYVEVLRDDFTFQKVSQEKCTFEYRTSAFKSTRKSDVIVGAELLLVKGDPTVLQKNLRERIQWRTAHHPPYQSAGCIFKNPAEQHYHKVSLDVIEERRPVEWFGRVPSGWLIDRAGLKGLRVGGAKVSEVHANFVMNDQNATAEDIIMLISIIKERVHRKFGVLLQEEVQYFGFQ